MNNEEIKSVANSMCETENHSLLYLVRAGSELYGTNTENSDTDVKGIFLPNKHITLIKEASSSLSYHTSNAHSKNTKDDVDIQLWSIQRFFELLKTGDINALDLLYSYSRPDLHLFCYDEFCDFLKNNHNKFYKLENLRGYMCYINSQCRKYGLKGTKVGILKELVEFIKNEFDVTVEDKSLRLNDILPSIIYKWGDDSLCFSKTCNNVPSFVLCGKIHMASITIYEFYKRIVGEYNKYGERAKKAEYNNGVDWKAVSHAMRSLLQMEELLNTGEIKYPLKDCKKLIDIKLEKEDWNDCNVKLECKLNELESIYKSIPKSNNNVYDENISNKFILKLYGEYVE